ncbi:MAG: ABC transporter substrate-binding protein [Peptococcaceae bacterium]|nr:ABC transporter substrate-binding protein [Peptococcaceae bacterium]
MNKSAKLIAIFLALLLLAATLAGCGQSAGGPPQAAGTGQNGSPAVSGGAAGDEGPSAADPARPGTAQAGDASLKTQYPVTVETYNEDGEKIQQVFEEAPQRIVSISQANTELLIALGLTDKIVATAHRFSPVYEKMEKEYNSISFIAEQGYPAKEVVLEQNPDILVGWGSLFAEDAMGPVSEWTERGIHTYLMNNTVTGLGDRTVEMLYDDIAKLGLIFDVQDKAQAMIGDMKERIGAISQKVTQLPQEQRVDVVTVQYVYENEFLARGGTDFNRNLAELAGGNHVCENGQQSLEVLIDLNPDVLVILDLSSSPAQEKIDAIKANPTLQSIKAVQNDRFVVLDHAAFYCGGPRTIEAVETLARGFYPQLFDSAL